MPCGLCLGLLDALCPLCSRAPKAPKSEFAERMSSARKAKALKTGPIAVENKEEPKPPADVKTDPGAVEGDGK